MKANRVRLPSKRQLAFRISHLQERSDLRILLFHLPDAVGSAVDLFLDEARAGRMFVTVDQAHQLRFGSLRAVGIDVKLNVFSRLSPRSCPRNQRF